MKQRITSREANEASKIRREYHYELIIKALSQLPGKLGIADSIAAFCPFDKVETSRRLSELRRAGKVKESGKYGKTVKGCRAICWQLCDDEIKENVSVQIGLFAA